MRKIIIFAVIIALIPINVNAKEEYFEKIVIAEDYEAYQPIDIHIEFKNPCYAINENEHSIKVLYKGKEIESQIYNLEFEGKRLKACNIVFLYQGKGEYIIKYGEEIKKVNYKDHIKVEESYYYVEPISGYFAKLSFYGIKEDDNLVFAICHEGSVLGIEMANKVVKLKDNAKEFNMQNIDQMFSLAFFKSDGKETGTDERLVAKKILVDGNLMAKVAIESSSSDGKLSTKAIYTYYYSPTKEKRLFIQLQHESKENLNKNLTYLYMICLKSRSKTIDELNIGEILPYIHLNGERGVEEYKMDTDPENKEFKWIISAKDNVVLGDKAWISIDDKKRAHAFILSNKLKVRAAVKEEIDVPGLEIDGGGVSLGSNQANKGIVYKGIIEFYSGNYNKIEEEANAFFDFLKWREFGEEEIKGGEVKKFNLSIVLHLRKSIPFSSYISALLGIKIPHIEAEIYSNNKLIAKGIVNFRKISFELPAGKYVIKIYKVWIKRKIIGIKYIELNENKKLHIFCSFEGFLKIYAKDGCKVRIIKDGIIEENITKNGCAILKLPRLNKYKLQLLYKGFLINEEEIFLLFNKEIEYSFDTYDFKVKVKDKLGFPFEMNLSTVLTSNEMIEKEYIEGKKEGNFYVFKNLPKGNYTLILSYKKFKVEKEVKVPGKEEIIFPAEFEIRVKLYDSKGFPIKCKIIFERNGKEFKKNLLPPAKYKIKAIDDKVIAEKDIILVSDSSYEIVTKKFSFYSLLLPLTFIIFFLIRRNFATFIAFLISLSTFFSWWNLTGKTKTFLYILPPKIIEMHGSYGSIANIPSLFRNILLAIFILILISVIMLNIQKLFKLSFIPLIASLSLFIYSIMKFTNITLGKLWGQGEIEGVYSEWGLGIGFYLALLSLVLLMGKVIINEFRRRR